MNNINQQIEEASNALNNEKYKKALTILEPLAKTQNAQALSMLGTMYQLGTGVTVDGKKAVELLSKAVSLGVGVAAHNLGTIYITGLPGIKKDAALSKKYYRLAKDMGAQFAEDKFYE